MRTTLMFKHPQTVRSFVLSFLFLALRPSTPWKTCFSSDPLFRSINSQSHCRQLLSIYPILCLAASSSLPSSASLSLSQQMVKWQCCQDGQWHSFIVLLFSPHVCLSFPLSFHLCLLEGRSRCLSSPPLSLDGWCCLKFSLISLSLSLTLIHTHTQTHTLRAAASALPTSYPTSFLFPPLPPTFLLQPQSFSSAHVYAKQDAALLHINAPSDPALHDLQRGSDARPWTHRRRTFQNKSHFI